MPRTKVSANTLKPRTKNYAEDVDGLTDTIESFRDQEVTSELIETTEQVQPDLKTEFEGFIKLLSEVNDDFT